MYLRAIATLQPDTQTSGLCLRQRRIFMVVGSYSGAPEENTENPPSRRGDAWLRG